MNYARLALIAFGALACGGFTGPQNTSNQPPPRAEWSRPVPLFNGPARISAGDRLHAVGTTHGALMHQSSTDEGATWSAPAAIPGTAHAVLPLYGPLAVERSTVHVLSRTGGSLQMRRSTDGGATWSTGTTLRGYAADESDRVQMDTDGNYVHVFVGRAGAVADHSFKIYYWRSADRGATWSKVAVLDDAAGAPSPGGVAAENGTVHIAYAAILPGVGTLGHRARYIRSVDNGATWSAPVDVGGGSSRPQIRPRPRVAAGRVFVLWEEPYDHDHNPAAPFPNATRGQIRGNRSLDNGSTWQGPFDVTAVTHEYPNHPEMGVGPGGLVHVAYRLSKNQATLTTHDVVGYRLSTDYGATWGRHETAVDFPGFETHLYNVLATTRFAHLVVGGTTFYHARRGLPEAP